MIKAERKEDTGLLGLDTLRMSCMVTSRVRKLDILEYPRLHQNAHGRSHVHVTFIYLLPSLHHFLSSITQLSSSTKGLLTIRAMLYVLLPNAIGPTPTADCKNISPLCFYFSSKALGLVPKATSKWLIPSPPLLSYTMSLLA